MNDFKGVIFIAEVDTKWCGFNVWTVATLENKSLIDRFVEVYNETTRSIRIARRQGTYDLETKGSPKWWPDTLKVIHYNGTYQEFLHWEIPVITNWGEAEEWINKRDYFHYI